ncbi:glycosyltransferase [Vibrio parahaemolyticus]|nr:glycosyltransferase [Vibrio parahaemolyticus]EIZ1365066.1 glycosyltransferase [Vibrio parahaemolyticus]ELA7199340.1 glycosyltransferase [Vibrio parahaemolyticus]EME0862105.1 glycosyltransferase [Vibrio parahaemolyticus]HCE1998644.1 glycosyltransferase [Vibrio parahaemolyticus]
MSEYKVSVIVALYNVESFVQQTLESLFNQTQDKVQYIIIDDGSTDNTLKIVTEAIDRFSYKKDVILISRENKGVSYSRQQGVDLALGDYIIHLDGDDTVESNWLSTLYQKALDTNADITICDYSLELSNLTKVIEQRFDVNDPIKALLNNRIQGFLWNKLISRELIIKNDVLFDRNTSYLEDFLFCLQCFLLTDKVVHIDKALINYNKRNIKSITSTVDEKKVTELDYASSKIKYLLELNGMLSRYLIDWHHLRLHQVVFILKNSSVCYKLLNKYYSTSLFNLESFDGNNIDKIILTLFKYKRYCYLKFVINSTNRLVRIVRKFKGMKIV